MASDEKIVLLRGLDESGNKPIIYPVTKLDCVDGADDLLHYGSTQNLTEEQKATVRANIGVGEATGDGFSPVANVQQTDDGAVITITDASGTTTATVTNGISPTVAVSKDGKVTTITITDKDGTKTATINDGADGTSGSGSGTVATYTNLVPTSTNADGTIYNSTGYKEGYRLNSSGTETEGEADHVVSGFIPYNGEVIRVWGTTEDNAGYTGNYISMYDSSFAMVATNSVVSANNFVTYGAAWEALDGKYILTVDPAAITSEAYRGHLASAKYIRASMAECTGEDFVVTLDEVMSDSSGGSGSATVTADSIKTALGYTPADAADVEALENELASISTGSTSAVPEYVTAEAERVAEAIKDARTAKSLVLLCASDIHTWMSYAPNVTATLHLAQGINEICKLVTVDGVVNLGDTVWGASTSTVQDCKDEYDHLRVNLGNTQGVPQIWLQGNHDNNAYNSAACLNADQLYTYIGANTTDKAVTDYDNLHRLYGYVDYDRQRIRVIYLNTVDSPDNPSSSFSVSTEQLQWLVATLSAVQAGWGVVVMSHHPLNWSNGTATVVLTILDAFKGKQSGTDPVTYDFTDAQGELICHLHGHIHNYQAQTFGTNGVLSITIPNGCFGRNNEYGTGGTTAWGDADTDGNQRVFAKTADTAEDTAYTAVVIERKNGKVHALRCGAGVDRIWDYVNGVEIEVETPDQPEDPDAPITDYVNLVPTSIDTDGSIYNETGYKEGYRLNSSGTETEQSEAVASGFIPYNGEVIRVWGSTQANVGGTGNYIAMYDSSFTKIHVLGGTACVEIGGAWEALDGKYMLTIDPDVITNATYKGYLESAAYIRCSMAKCTGEDFVVTLNDAIDDTTDGSGDTSDGSGDSTVAYTNQVPISMDYDGDGVFNSVGYMNNYYATIDAPYYKADSQGCCVTGIIPYDSNNPQTIYIKGVGFTTSQSHNRIGFFKGLVCATTQTVSNLATYFTITELGTNYYKLEPITSSAMTSWDYDGGINISAYGDGANMIVTINEPIE